MSSALTVSAVRDRLFKFVLPGDDLHNPDFLPYLNDARERIFNSGKWNKMTSVVDFSSTAGYIALPLRYGSILAAQIYDVPRSIEGRYYEYLGGGPGQLDTDAGLGLLIDDGFSPTEVDIETAGTLRFTLNAADVDATKNIRYEGLDGNGDVIYDTSGNRGVNVTTSAATVNGTHTVSRVTSITLPEGLTYPVTVSVVVSGTATELAVIEPGVTQPEFHRYKVGTIAENDTYPTVVRCLCKLRYTKLVAETDIVLPSNLGALKLALMALGYEDQNDIKTSKIYWADAYALLNDEIKEARGGATLRVRFSPNSGLPKVRFIR